MFQAAVIFWSGSGLGKPKIDGPGTSVGAGSGGLSLRESETCSSEGQAACGVETRAEAGLGWDNSEA